MFIESIVGPIPASSLIVGSIILIFSYNNSRLKTVIIILVKSFIKKILKKRELREKYFSLICYLLLFYRLRLSSMNATPIAAISATSSNPGIPPAVIVISNSASW